MSKQYSTLSKGRNFTIESFDIVAVCGNKVKCCFDKVERCFDIVAGVDGALETFGCPFPLEELAGGVRDAVDVTLTRCVAFRAA